MTIDDLEEMILGPADVGVVAEAFAGLDEAQRKKLSTAARKIYRQLVDNKLDETASERMKALMAERQGVPWHLQGTLAARKATLALFASGPLSALKSGRIFVGFHDDKEVERILADRRPEWLGAWVHNELEKQFSTLQFPTLRNWIKAGLCQKPDHDRYYEVFAGYLMRTRDLDAGQRHPVPPISEQLLADPDLLDDVFSLFRVETIAFNTNSWLSHDAGSNYETWPQALKKLAQAGALDRGRLLDASLEGLTQDLKQNQLAGIHRFHREMEPTPDEMRTRQSAYLALLCHRVAHVSKFGVEMAAKLQQQGALDSEIFLREVQSVFLLPAKGNAIAALKLIGRMLKKRPSLTDAALPAIREAMRSDNADVQTLALDLIEAQSGRLTADQFSEFASLADFVTPAARARFNAVLNVAEAEADRNGAEWSERDTIVHVANEGKPYSSISGEFGHLPVLPTVAPIAPIETLDELISVVSHAIEQVDSADEVERIIDGISRLCDRRPQDFDGRVGPVLHRMLSGGGTNSRGLMRGWNEAALAVTDLVMSWLTGRVSATAASPYTRSATDAFVPMQALLHAIAQRAVAQRSQQLLCAPTHQNGWIDPQTWIARLIEADRSQVPIEQLDLSYSLIRLAPDHRSAALGRCGELSGHLGRLAIFALGGEECPSPDDRAQHAVWIAAARARNPAADWSAAFVPLNLEDQWPDALRPAVYSWRAFMEDNKGYNGHEWKQPKFVLERVPATNQEKPAPTGVLKAVAAMLAAPLRVDWRDVPTAALNHTSKGDQRWLYDHTSIWVSQWLSHLWPQNPAAVFATTAAKLAHRMDADSSTFEPSAGFMNCFFQKNRPWGEMGHLALMLGLSGKDADVSGLAIDALIEGIESGQFDPDVLGAALAKFAQGGWMKPGRIGLALQRAARVSPLHAWAVGEAIQCGLSGLDLRAPNMFALVELLLECQLTVRQPVTAAAAVVLKEARGDGKMAKAARRLLEINRRDESIIREVRRMALVGRAANSFRHDDEVPPLHETAE